ncbi:MAG: hypothetical protein JWM53_4969 [bacterium]|nr:hypothetical protein [bacterium]
MDTQQQPPKTRVDRSIEWLKNNKVTAPLIVAGIIVLAVGGVFDAVRKSVPVAGAKSKSAQTNSSGQASLNLPGGSGWVLLGEYDDEKKVFARGPLWEVVRTNYPDKSMFPRKGEQIQLKATRNVVVPHFRSQGLKDSLTPPWQLNTLVADDYTGISLPKDTVVEVRDVSLGHFEGMPFVVWVRVAEVTN